MNAPEIREFEALVAGAVEAIAASPGRKSVMREELLEHLLERYQAELCRQPDARSAVRTAIGRMGNANELRAQLQATVPLPERLLHLFLDRKERFMSRWLWVLGIAAIVAADALSFPQSEQVQLAGVALVSGLAFRHLWQKDKSAPRLIGPAWPWLPGFVAVMFGTALILPAMAKMKQAGGPSLLPAEFMAVGAIIALGGLGLIAHGIKTRPATPA